MQKPILLVLLALTSVKSIGFESQGSCTSRSVFLNGVDISGATSQELKKVNLHINENGDVYISAPHYEAFEEDHYLPISKYLKSLNTPEHKKPVSVSRSASEDQRELMRKSPDSQNSPVVSRPLPDTDPTGNAPFLSSPASADSTNDPSLNKQGSKSPDIEPPG